MKHLKKNFQILLSAVIMLTICGIASIHAQSDALPAHVRNDSVGLGYDPMDSIEVSLLTCSPHEEVYSLYGHSAFRWHNVNKTGPGAGEDWVFNWGIFNFNKPHFVARFVFGLTDYELCVYPFSHFPPYYRKWGSSITEQVLNLTNAEKRQLRSALSKNLEPDQKIYRYNYFYDNCSTRPRNVIEKSIDGKIEYAEREDFAPSYRDMVHYCVRNHPWARFGNDMLLGIKADWPTSRQEQEFLPENLMFDFDHAQIYANGEHRPLVKERRMIVPPGVQIVEEDFPLSPLAVFGLLSLVSLVVFAIEFKRHKTFKYWDALWMLAQGATGCVLFIMIFSQHPTTSINLQILLLNPLPLFFVPCILQRRRCFLWWKMLLAMIILFCLGSLFQKFAEGMMLVALCLLLRFLSNYIHAQK